MINGRNRRILSRHPKNEQKQKRNILQAGVTLYIQLRVFSGGKGRVALKIAGGYCR